MPLKTFRIEKLAATPCFVDVVTWVALACTAPFASAADVYLTGTMTNITTHAGGLMIMLDTGVPTNCTGTPFGWLTIRESNKTMVAAALLAWHTGNRGVTVYTDSAPPGSWCYINQFDPN